MHVPSLKDTRSAALDFAKRETGLLIALLIVALALWGFLRIAEEMGEGDTRGFDAWLLLAMRTGDHHQPVGPMWLPLAATDITALGGFTVLTLITVLATGYLLISRKFADAWVLLGAVLGATALSEGLKLGYARPRPDLVAHAVETMGASFPSGHATLSAAAYLTIGALLARGQEKRRVKTYIHVTAVLIALLIGVSRVYLGVHWPTDVLAGWCLGAAWSIACVTLAGWLQRRGRAKSGP
ncbi:MAG TPA: phosphatase PAP2 family protein [Vitreimonas sp.]|nr:phosphatase PAP2 family protein [Vitreimonas sp.]